MMCRDVVPSRLWSQGPEATPEDLRPAMFWLCMLGYLGRICVSMCVCLTTQNPWLVERMTRVSVNIQVTGTE